MADLKTDEIPINTCSIPVVNGADPPESDVDSAGEKSMKKDRESKRRKKNCPSSLEKFESQNSSSNSSFSFSFDTKSAGILQFTPKFGSFKLTEPAPEIEGCCGKIPAESPAREEEEESEISNKRRKIVEVLSSIDVIKSDE